MSKESYLFITPKIEQYVINNGDDFVASLNGVALPSVKEDDKKKLIDKSSLVAIWILMNNLV